MLSKTDDVSVPPAHSLPWPTLAAMKNLGGSAAIAEFPRAVADIIGLTEEQQAIPHGNGSRSEFEYRLAWARTYLKKIGAAENSSRGVWSVTERGRQMTEDDVEKALRDWRSSLVRTRKQDAASNSGDESNEVGEPETDEDPWKAQLLEILQAMEPYAFQRLFVRVLKEAGFVNVQASPPGGDDGIDGTGIYNLSLVSFPVYFQCKRWKGSVGSQELRNFRGAMVGRAEHALFVTTSSFTSNAQTEASRPGAPPIDLIDGDRLCELLQKYEIGVRSIPRTVYDVKIDAPFFDDV